MNFGNRILCALLLCCALLPAVAAIAQGQPEKRLLIVAADPANLPELSIGLGLFDEQGQPVHDLLADEVKVSVDGKPLTETPKLVPDPHSPAVAIVADFSAAMSDQSVPGRNRLASMREQIDQLLVLLPPDAPVSLITVADQPKVEVDWRAGANDVRTTLAALANKGLPSAAQNAPYPLSEAITLGLNQLTKPDQLIDGHPTALVVYAAGAPGQAIDSATLRATLDGIPLNQPTITFVGLGGSDAGQFANQPGNPQSLAQAAAVLPNAAFLPFFTADANETQLLQNNLDARYRAIMNTSQIYTLLLDVAALPAGPHTIDITARGATASIGVQLPAVPPKIALHPTGPVLQNGAQIYVDVVYRQRPLKQVEYFLDGHSLGVSTDMPQFIHTVDIAQLYASEGPLSDATNFNQPHELTAVATDVDGKQSAPSKSEQVIVPPPVPTAGQWARQHWPILALALLATLLAAAIGWLVFKKGIHIRQDIGSSTASVVREPNPFDSPTIAVSPSNAMWTVAVPAAAAKLRVTVLAGLDRREYPLQQGREWKVGRRPEHAIWLDNGQVSHDHARLTLADGGVQITDLRSTNGTFVRESKQPLTPERAEFIRFGEVFWIGPDIKLMVEQR